MFTKVLIANRGEIACRIARTLRAMGVRSVAVCSDADRGALHTRVADETRVIGPAEPRASYLDVESIVRAARASGAQAIHPGYGFLAENAAFAAAVEAAGLVFIGPTPEQVRTMGDKRAARVTNDRAPQRQMLHSAGHVAELNRVTHYVLVFEHDVKAGDQVAHQILRSEAHRDARKSCQCQCWCRVDAEKVERGD